MAAPNNKSICGDLKNSILTLNPDMVIACALRIQCHSTGEVTQKMKGAVRALFSAGCPGAGSYYGITLPASTDAESPSI